MPRSASGPVVGKNSSEVVPGLSNAEAELGVVESAALLKTALATLGREELTIAELVGRQVLGMVSGVLVLEAPGL